MSRYHLFGNTHLVKNEPEHVPAPRVNGPGLLNQPVVHAVRDGPIGEMFRQHPWKAGGAAALAAVALAAITVATGGLTLLAVAGLAGAAVVAGGLKVTKATIRYKEPLPQQGQHPNGASAVEPPAGPLSGAGPDAGMAPSAAAGLAPTVTSDSSQPTSRPPATDIGSLSSQAPRRGIDAQHAGMMPAPAAPHRVPGIAPGAAPAA